MRVWDEPQGHDEVSKPDGHAVSIKVRDGDVVVCTIVNEQQARPVIPRAECVQPKADGTYVARLGYTNRNTYPVDIELGPRNRLEPAALQGSQPTWFDEGGGHVFEVAFGDGSVTWHLDGNTATARVGMRLCQELPTLVVRKVVVGSNRPPSDFSFDVAGRATAFDADGENIVSLPAGTYSVSETPVTGFTTTSEGCTDVTVAVPQETAPVCTITNTAQTTPPGAGRVPLPHGAAGLAARAAVVRPARPRDGHARPPRQRRAAGGARSGTEAPRRTDASGVARFVLTPARQGNLFISPPGRRTAIAGRQLCAVSLAVLAARNPPPALTG